MISPYQPLRPWAKCDFCGVVKNENDVCSSREESYFCDAKYSWLAPSHKVEQRAHKQRMEELKKNPEKVESLDKAKLRIHNEYAKVLLSNCLEHLNDGDLKTVIVDFLEKEKI